MARFDPGELPPAVVAFLRERHLGTLTTLRPDGTPHVVPVGFSYAGDSRLARVITAPRNRKVRNVDPGSRAVRCQVDGARWLSLEGEARVVRHSDGVATAVAGYADRYRPPRPRPDRVAIEITVDRILGHVPK